MPPSVPPGQRRGREKWILLVAVASVTVVAIVSYSSMFREESRAAHPPPPPLQIVGPAVPRALDDAALPPPPSPPPSPPPAATDAEEHMPATTSASLASAPAAATMTTTAAPAATTTAAPARECATRATTLLFDLDKPRAPDEEAFCHMPKSKGGQLREPNFAASPHWDDLLRKTLKEAYELFKLFDNNESSPLSMPVYGTMCVGKDCPFIPTMIAHLRIGIGHFIVVVNTNDKRWVTFFATLQELFPGRFSMFNRPHKLSCAESWNVVVRMGFSIRPMVEQVFIANADWHPRPTPGIDNNMARFAEWSRTKLHLVVSRYYHFSSFSFTQKGYLELGYFDEVIYPAYAEDIEFHCKAVSKGLGELGMYDQANEGSVHQRSASRGDRVLDVRSSRVSRFDYVFRKWGVRIPDHSDFARASPYKTPWDCPAAAHNNSWAVDPVHRQCADTGAGGWRYANSGRCGYDVGVLKRAGVVPQDFKFNDKISAMADYF